MHFMLAGSLYIITPGIFLCFVPWEAHESPANTVTIVFEMLEQTKVDSISFYTYKFQ